MGTTTIARIELRGDTPKIGNLLALADALDITAASLLEAA